MGPTIRADRRDMTLAEALKHDKNVLLAVSRNQALNDFVDRLWKQRSDIAALVRHHLALAPADACDVLPWNKWICGRFNICVFVRVRVCNANKDAKDARTTPNVVFRCPLPHELSAPGAVAEKMTSEVGNYVWIDEFCPDIRIPHLYGFAFDGHYHTHANQLPLLSRLHNQAWRSIHRSLQRPLLSKFVEHPPDQSIAAALPLAYMVLEFIGPKTGQALSNTFCREPGTPPDPVKMERLSHGLCQAMLALARTPLPSIGSLCFHQADGTVTLANRALFASMVIPENEGAPHIVKPRTLHCCSDSFVSDILTFHDRTFLQEPHAARDEGDCRFQMAILATLRLLAPRYLRQELRSGPFFLQFTDLHASNVFVDDEWNVTAFVDLEWICALPCEMLDAPYWLTGPRIDDMMKNADGYDKARQAFMKVWREEEAKSATAGHAAPGLQLSNIMDTNWNTRSTWFSHCLSSVNAMHSIVEDHLLPPKEMPIDEEVVLSSYWKPDHDGIVRRKLEQRKAYDDDVRALFPS